jgi:hypothetical protein
LVWKHIQIVRCVTIDSERKTGEKGSENTYMPRRIASASAAASVTAIGITNEIDSQLDENSHGLWLIRERKPKPAVLFG